MSTIITRNSANSGSTPASLVQGELAINVTDGRLFYGSGSGNVVKEFTGSASGGTTIDTGSFVTTSSFNAYTGSNTSQFAGTSSFATNALTASYAPSTPAFPYTGSAEITGSLGVTGSLANGNSVLASGSYSHAEGDGTQAVGDYSHAEGASTQAVGGASHAEGEGTQAVGSFSHAEGSNTQAVGDYSHAEGASTQAVGSYSHAEGFNTKTGTQNAYYAQSVTSGVITLSGSYGDVAFGFGVDSRLYLYDEPFDSNYNRATFIISQSYFDSNNTIIELYDTSVTTTTAYVGDLGQGINNWGGDQIIPGDYSHAEGASTQAVGGASHAEGDNTQAIGSFSHAEGDNTQAVGYASHAEGFNTQAVGGASHAEGRNTQAVGSHSHAEGSSTQAVGEYSHAEGSGTQAVGGYSHAEGDGTRTGTQNAYYAQSVASGIITLPGSYGDIASSFGVDNRLYLYDEPFDYNYGRAIFIISQSYFNSNNTIIELYDTSVTTTTAYVGDLGQGINNWGGDQIIPGDYSHAEGASTQAVGGASHAEGDNTQAIGDYSHAEGINTQAVGFGSHAEGQDTQAVGGYSHAEGFNTQAVGGASHAEGRNTQAVGDFSHAEGLGTIASGSYQHVTGQYNVPISDPSSFVVGNGADVSNRSNLLVAHGNTVQVTGSTEITGSLGVTGSFSVQTYNPFVAATATAIELTGTSRNIYDTSGFLSIDAFARTANYQSAGSSISIDWQNSFLYDFAGNASINWNSRDLIDSSNTAVFNWDAFALNYKIETNTYLKRFIDLGTQEAFSDVPTIGNFNYEGEVIEGILDNNVAQFDLVYLETDGIWYQVTQGTDNCSKLLGICAKTGVSPKVILEGSITVNDSTLVDSPYVQLIDNGLPIYIRDSSGTTMSTVTPTTSGQYVRILGHAYYQNTASVEYWTMKFRPSNDWVVI